MAHREIIDNNLVHLCNLTKCSKRLLERCRMEEVLTRDDVEAISIIQVELEKNLKFFDCLRRADFKKFNKAINIMQEKDIQISMDVIRVLKGQSEPISAAKLPADFVIAKPANFANPVQKQKRVGTENVKPKKVAYLLTLQGLPGTWTLETKEVKELRTEAQKFHGDVKSVGNGQARIRFKDQANAQEASGRFIKMDHVKTCAMTETK